MAKDGRLLSLCAGALVLAGLIALRPANAGDRDSAVATTLAVQTAMQQGRDHLVHGDAKSAVYVLEGQLSRINGNSAYLAVLRDAYRAYIKQLRLANQEADAQVYLERLQILDPGAALDGAVARGSIAPATTPGAGRPEPTVVRGTMAEEDRQSRASSKEQPARGLVAKAEEEFRNRHYREAGQLFEQAHASDPAALAGSRERWAYCKLHRVFEQIEEQSPAWQDLEREAQRAIEMAPRLEAHGKLVLSEIKKRRGPSSEDAGALAIRSSQPIRHFERGQDGWARAETANFRVFHNQSRELAEQVARVAENTRSSMCRKWFGGVEPDWSPKCDLYLHATARDYSQATGVGIGSPGHSTFSVDHGRILQRRIDLHCEAKNLLAGVLPHETTHVVVAGQFGDQPVPRWADEGMAVLTEPRELIERHFYNLPAERPNGPTLSIRQLVQLNDKYPAAHLIPAFYAESVSLVEYLSSLRGPQAFSQFLRDAQRQGYESALNRAYGIRGFDELERRWSQYAATNRPGNIGVASK